MKLSMKKRTLFSFVSMFCLFGIAIGGTTWALKSLTSQLEKAIQNDLELKDTLRQIDANGLEQASNQRSYKLTQSEDSKETFNYLTGLNNDLVKKAREFELEYSSDLRWEDLIKFYSSYTLSVNKMMDVVVREGNSTNGIRGQLRAYAHEIEEAIKKYNLKPLYTIHLLTFRRREKDFILRRDNKYYEKLTKDTEEFLNRLAGEDYAPEVKNQLRTSVDNYVNTFSKFVKNQEEADKLSSLAADEQMKVQGIINEIIQIVNKKSSERILKIQSFKDKLFMGILGGAVFIIFLIFLFQRNFTKSINKIVELSEKLKNSAKITEKSSSDMSNASEKVSSSATQQASAIQETVATLNEITAMVNKSVESAKLSSEKADASQKVAYQGKEAVQEMINAIGDIDISNNDIMNEMTRSNQEFTKIVQVINEISEKTKVINDIVFQTKLLSFNASVEAARAGEHGKGFAVVAEEVGNLAQMSGNAAREIEDLLSGSIKTVEKIVDETQSKVSTLISGAKVKIDTGVDVSKKCGDILDRVVENVASVTSMMTEISSASEEQAEGINNITTAMNELDEATHSNSNVAHETSNYAADLSTQTQVLNSIVEELDSEVLGNITNKPDVVKKQELLKENPSDNREDEFLDNITSIESLKENPQNDESLTPTNKDDDDDDFPSEDDPRFKEVV